MRGIPSVHRDFTARTEWQIHDKAGKTCYRKRKHGIRRQNGKGNLYNLRIGYAKTLGNLGAGVFRRFKKYRERSSLQQVMLKRGNRKLRQSSPWKR